MCAASEHCAGVLSEEELGNKLYVAELGRQEYAAHVSNLRAYDAISRDIIQRWAFPLVPDTNLLWRGGAWGPTTFRYARGNRCARGGCGRWEDWGTQRGGSK
eukprot:scaffold20493_cov19-Tisochrysis_lutea.AAC.1